MRGCGSFADIHDRALNLIASAAGAAAIVDRDGAAVWTVAGEDRAELGQRGIDALLGDEPLETEAPAALAATRPTISSVGGSRCRLGGSRPRLRARYPLAVKIGLPREKRAQVLWKHRG
jgi:hypothetical protein